MKYADYETGLRSYRSMVDVAEYGRVREDERDWALLRLLWPGRRWLTITSGFHGDEVAGPLTLLERLPQIVDYARSREVGLRIYPCVNPSGFERGSRYNASGERPNNDLLRYEIAPGVWRGELKQGETPLRFVPFREGPKETRALLADLEGSPAPAAALDIHQDPYLEGAFAYAYVFGERAAYQRLLETTRRFAKVATDRVVDEAAHAATDSQGLVELYDGSVTDYFFRRGVSRAAALETTTGTPAADADAVNLAWIRGFIDLASGDEIPRSAA
jgi:hypothetical protein